MELNFHIFIIIFFRGGTKSMKKLTNKEKVEKAFETLRTGVIDLINNPNELETFFQAYGEQYQYNKYSPRNTVLLMFQTSARKNRMFQMARGYKQWQKEFNRTVKKGEKAMQILAPRQKVVGVEVNEETGEETKKYITYFKIVNVFELSQTEGEPIPRNYDKNHLYKSTEDYQLQDFISKCGVNVEFEDLIEANGYTDGKRIVIGRHNNDLAGICTLFHELAHYHLHYSNDGDELKLYSKEESVNFKELEAEAVAFMVSSALGIENDYSKNYIRNWNSNVKNIDEEFEKRSYKLLMEALNQIDTFMVEVQG